MRTLKAAADQDHRWFEHRANDLTFANQVVSAFILKFLALLSHQSRWMEEKAAALFGTKQNNRVNTLK